MAETRLESTGYRGDDFPQKLAKTMWLPFVAMGVMAVALGLVTGAYSGTQLGDFFGGDPAVKFGRATSTSAWSIGTVFLGLGFILSSITMVLVNIIRTLRDTGRDVQQAVGAHAVTQLKKPLAGKLVPHVMMMGLFTVIAGFALGIWQANLLGGVPAAGLANPATLHGGNLADYGTAQAIGAWIQPLRLFGLALIFTSVVLALRTIIKGIRFQAQRIEELSLDGRLVAAS
jgi:hypothetical protein